MAGCESAGVCGGDKLGHGFQLYASVEGVQPLYGGVCLGQPRLMLAVQHLTLEVAQAHGVGVGHGDMTHTGPRKVYGCGAAQAARAGHEHTARGKFLLAFAPEARQHGLAAIAVCFHQSNILSQSFHTGS